MTERDYEESLRYSQSPQSLENFSLKEQLQRALQSVFTINQKYQEKCRSNQELKEKLDDKVKKIKLLSETFLKLEEENLQLQQKIAWLKDSRQAQHISIRSLFPQYAEERWTKGEASDLALTPDP